MSKTVAVAEFEAHALELLEEAAERQEEIVVIRGGKAIGKLAPMTGSRPMTLDELRALGGRVVGDIVEPLEEWDMTK
jgi:antitoxin (DNA-binding transcriptional repressor) of toxin-antitoxin stability system